MSETATAAATKWVLDPTHSEVQFKIKHLVISTVTGSFKTFQGSLQSEGDAFENAQVEFSLDVDSINTNQEQRDAHLRGEEFFDSANYPQIKFVSTSFEKESADTYKVTGSLTVKDVTKPVVLGRGIDQAAHSLETLRKRRMETSPVLIEQGKKCRGIGRLVGPQAKASG